MMRAGSLDNPSIINWAVWRLARRETALATSVGPSRAAIVFDVVMVVIRSRPELAQCHSLISTKWPAMAAAAAIAGETRWVRPLKPWRPSKLRLEVEAHRSPGA